MPITNNTWNVNADGNWATAANWSRGTVPDSNNDAVINTASVHTVTHDSGNDTVNSLTVGNDHFVLSGGSLSLVTGGSFALDYTQVGGQLLGTGNVAITGNGTMTGGYAGGSLAFQIGGTIALANYTLGGSASLENDTTVNQTGQVTLGDNTGVNATINNTASATYNIANDSGIGQGAVSAKFINAGLLTKTAGNGTSIIGANITDTGTIAVATGTLQFNGANNSFAGTISGNGQFAIGGGGASSIAAATSITSAAFAITDSGTTVTLKGSLTYAGSFSQGFGSVLNLNGKTLTLTGPASFFNAGFATPTVTGSGTLTTRGTTNVNLLVLGGTVNWNNAGTVNQTGTLQIGDSSANATTLTNQANKTYNLTNDSGITRGNAATSAFINKGTLAKTAGAGTSVVSVSVNSTGRISVGTGTLQFNGPGNSFAGTINGAGQFAIGGGGANTIAGGTTINVGTFGIYDTGTSVTLGGDLSYAGTFNQLFGTTLHLAGHTLTLSGTATFANAGFATPVVNGSGTLATSGTTNVNIFTLGGTVGWNNTGTVNEVGTLFIGDGSGNAATFTNAVGGTYNLTNDSGIVRGSAATSRFINQGTLAKTAGNGTSLISVGLTNTGTISVASGTIELTGPVNSVGGTITGAGQFMLGGGSTNTIAAGTTANVGTFSIADTGTNVTLAGNLSYGGVFNQTFGSTLSLGANTLTLSGTASFANAGFATPAVTGSGTLATSGQTTVSGLNIGGTVRWNNSGTVTQTNQNLTLGDNAGNAVVLTNSSIYNIVDDSDIARGSSTQSRISNSGTFEKTGGNGTTTVAANILNSGNILVSSGLLDLQGNATGNGGTMTISGDSALELDAKVAGQTIVFANGGSGDLTLNDAVDFTSKVSGFDSTDSIDIGGFNSGATTFSYSENGAQTQGTLTLTNGSNQAKIVFLGNYDATGFHLVDDGHGGSLLSYSPPGFARMAAAETPSAHLARADDPAAAPTAASHPPGFSDFVQSLFNAALDPGPIANVWDHGAGSLASTLAAIAGADFAKAHA